MKGSADKQLRKQQVREMLKQLLGSKEAAPESTHQDKIQMHVHKSCSIVLHFPNSLSTSIRITF